MLKLLADTNVLFDFIANRHPFDHEARLLLFGAAMGDYELWISSSQVTDLHFLITHGEVRLSSAEATDQLQELRKHVRIASLTEGDIDNAIDSGWSDFEDACMYFVARHMKANYIITRNKKDFTKSTIPVLTPEEFLQLFAEEQGVSYADIGL